MKRKLFGIFVLSIFIFSLNAQESRHLSLLECRDMALQENTKSKIAHENIVASEAMRKAALAKFFPKFSANGAYMWNQKNISILAEDALLPIGGKAADGSWTITNLEAQTNNTIVTLPDGTKAPVDNNGVPFDPRVNPEKLDLNYAYLPKDALEFDVHNIFVAQIGVTQPIFLGGKLVQLYKIAKANEAIAGIQSDKANDDIIISVDEAYWRVVSVQNKLKLANEYESLLVRLNQDVQTAMDEGMATKADLLRVKVKLNEAQMSRQKAEDGLVLSKMALCQVVGLPLDTDIEVDSINMKDIHLEQQELDMNSIWESRPEIQLLEQAEKIAKAGRGIVASGLMPNIVASANYLWTNPNLFNGFDKSFAGMFNVGVVVNVPIAHADAILQYKAAKHKANVISLQLEEAKEKIELQANQSNQKVAEANHKLARANANIANAEENLRLAQASYEEGMLTATELMGVQTQWLQARSEQIDAAIDARLCELYLLQHTGKL